MFNKVPTLSVFFKIYSFRAHKREATDMTVGCRKIKNKPRLFSKNNLEIFWIFFFFFSLKITSEALTVFD